jgi:predicted dehydrogenase
MKRKELGVAVIGAGRIGTLRARLAARHPAVHFLAVSDVNEDSARALAERTGADVYSTNNLEMISRPEVNAVIVSTPEHEHVEPVRQALELGKPVLMEKPLGLTLADADQILAAVEKTRGDLRIGYIRRFKRCFARAKQQVLDGHLGKICGGTARVYNTRAQAFEILKRNPEATPVVDVLTYFVDLMLWFNEGNPPAEVIARATYSAPITPLALGRFSTITLWPSVSLNLGAMTRPTRSFGPAAALGTMIRTGLFGRAVA